MTLLHARRDCHWQSWVTPAHVGESLVELLVPVVPQQPGASLWTYRRVDWSHRVKWLLARSADEWSQMKHRVLGYLVWDVGVCLLDPVQWDQHWLWEREDRDPTKVIHRRIFSAWNMEAQHWRAVTSLVLRYPIDWLGENPIEHDCGPREELTYSSFPIDQGQRQYRSPSHGRDTPTSLDWFRVERIFKRKRVVDVNIASVSDLFEKSFVALQIQTVCQQSWQTQ